MLNTINEIKRKVGECLKNNKFFLILIVSAFLIGLIIGILSLVTYREIVNIKNLIDKPLFLYIKEEIGLFSFFIRKFFQLILICLISFLICCNKFTKYLYLLISIYLGYVVVFNMGVIILCFGFFGFVFSLFITLLIGIISFVLISIIALTCCDCLVNNNFFINFKNRLSLYLILVLSLFLICLIEMILLPIFSSTFIINYL